MLEEKFSKKPALRDSNRKAIQLVLHLGAKPQPGTRVRDRLADPEGLLTWKGADRATVTFREPAEVKARSKALTSVLRQWLPFVP